MISVYGRGLRAPVLVSLVLLAGCGDHVSPVRENSGPPAVKSIASTAFGASDAVGYNASVPCANPPVVAMPTCPGGTGYVPVIARALALGGAV